MTADHVRDAAAVAVLTSFAWFGWAQDRPRRGGGYRWAVEVRFSPSQCRSQGSVFDQGSTAFGFGVVAGCVGHRRVARGLSTERRAVLLDLLMG
jgi:hypothetical protein